MMAVMSLSKIVAETGGSLSADVDFSRVSTDTRNIQEGDIFVALVGDKYDGNKFVKEAQSKGASAVVVNSASDCDIPQWVVNDSKVAYGVIAKSNRRLFSGVVIGLTGSAGKTSTKEMIAAILSQCGSVLATKSNFNNEVGVPLTLLEINTDHKYAVIEMGASAVGDIRYLSQFVEPDIALVTNARAVHIEGFGDIDSIAATKGEIFESLTDAGIAVVNKDDDYFDLWTRQAGTAKVVSFSRSNNAANFYAQDIHVNNVGTTRFTLCCDQQEIEINLQLLGKHNVTNAIAATAVAMMAGADLQQVKVALDNICPVPGRLETKIAGDLMVIDDTYNASPASVNAATDVLAGLSGKRTLILGTMGELGSKAGELHKRVASYAKNAGIDQMLAVGEFSKLMVAEFDGLSKSFNNTEELIAELNLLDGSDVVLIKGSRSAHMEKVVEALIEVKDFGLTKNQITENQGDR